MQAGKPETEVGLGQGTRHTTAHLGFRVKKPNKAGWPTLQQLGKVIALFRR